MKELLCTKILEVNLDFNRFIVSRPLKSLKPFYIFITHDLLSLSHDKILLYCTKLIVSAINKKLRKANTDSYGQRCLYSTPLYLIVQVLLPLVNLWW